MGDHAPVQPPDEQFRRHAAFFDRTAPLYAVLLRACADDRAAGGPVRAVCAGRDDDPPGSALALRLAGALQVAAAHEAPVDAEPSAPWLRRMLAEPAVPTVVWHSVMRQYVPDEHWDDVAAELEAARRRMPVLELAYEPPGPDHLSMPRLTLDDERLAQGAAHGVPCFAGAG